MSHTTVVPELKQVPGTSIAVLVSNFDQLTDLLPADDGAYLTPHDRAILDARKNGWTVASEGEADFRGEDVTVTILEKVDK